MNHVTFTAVVVLVAALVPLAWFAGRASGAAEANKRLFVLRTYTTPEGKLDALNARFRNHSVALFEKHGAQLVGFWTPTEPTAEPNKLIYLMAFADKAAHDACFAAFRADPAWIKAKSESEKDGSLTTKVESLFLSPTDYSKMN